MIGGAEADAQRVQHSFVSEVFHNLSQPLTALQCSLELSLFRDQTIDELRTSVETALQNTGMSAGSASCCFGNWMKPTIRVTFPEKPI